MKQDRINIPISTEDKQAIVKDGFKHGFRSVSEYIREKMLGNLDSDEIKTLKAKNANLMKLLKDQEDIDK